MSQESRRNVPRAERFRAPIRAVVDAGVLRSAVWGGRSSTTVVDAWLEGEVLFCVTESIMSGYFSALGRIAATPLVAVVLDHLRSGESVRAFRPGAEFAGPPEDRLVACARVAEAQAVVTHDPELLHLGPVGGIEMLTPGAFLQKYLQRR